MNHKTVSIFSEIPFHKQKQNSTELKKTVIKVNNKLLKLKLKLVDDTIDTRSRCKINYDKIR